ncbi:MAG: GNAT family N-acetyltransferase [Microbacterium sp.]
MLPETPRLALRELRDGDVGALHLALGDAEAMVAYEHGFSERETRDWIARQRQRYETDGFGLWGVELRGGGMLLGDCGLTRQLVNDREVLEVGYHLRRDRWGHGYASEAARACVRWAFTHLDAPEVWAIVRDTNLASMNVAIRCGMTVRERIVKRYRGKNMPHLCFAISRAEFDKMER